MSEFEQVTPSPDHPARRELFSDFEHAADRLERSAALNLILESIGVEEPTYEDIAKIQRWADGYNAVAVIPGLLLLAFMGLVAWLADRAIR